jgi:hypothetical protein
MAISTHGIGMNTTTGNMHTPQGNLRVLTKMATAGAYPANPRPGEYVWNSTSAAISAGGTSFAANSVYRRVGNAWVQQ